VKKGWVCGGIGRGTFRTVKKACVEKLRACGGDRWDGAWVSGDRRDGGHSNISNGVLHSCSEAGGGLQEEVNLRLTAEQKKSIQL